MAESILFEMYKDTSALSNDRKRRRIQLKFPKINVSQLHRKILNYQVKKYGQNLV